jgi:hypothetical protein
MRRGPATTARATFARLRAFAAYCHVPAAPGADAAIGPPHTAAAGLFPYSLPQGAA